MCFLQQRLHEEEQRLAAEEARLQDDEQRMRQADAAMNAELSAAASARPQYRSMLLALMCVIVFVCVCALAR